MHTSGVHIDNVKTLCTDIQDYLEKIQDNLRQTFDTFEKAKNYYNGSNRDEFFKKIENLKMSIDIISSNLNSYVDDYNKVIESYLANDEEIIHSIHDLSIEGKEDI